MDLSRLLLTCHLWGTASLSQLLAMHGRIYSLALVRHQMITAMIAGILASCVFAGATSSIRQTNSTITTALLGTATELALGSFAMLALRNPEHWAHSWTGGPS